MQKHHGLIAMGAAIALAVLGVFLYYNRAEAPTEDVETPINAQKTFRSGEANLRFSYDASYYLDKRDAGPLARAQTAIVLVEDTKENRDLLDGKVTEPREGPTAITIDVYDNPENLSAEAWAATDTNWNVSMKQTSPVTVGGVHGVSFLWDGLYTGKSVIVTHQGKAYVFGVTWMSDTDPILEDFGELLTSVQFED